MTGTSGGGFALMTEAIGLAAMTETPVVVAEVQRGGPSTGLPTKTEQGDLFQALGASQGEFPKAIIAPYDVADCYQATIDSLNIADKYQIPVMLLSDLLLSEHQETVDPEQLNGKPQIDRGERVSNAGEGYKRYAVTPSGVSPRAVPGTPGGMHIAASDDHDEDGVIISDIFTNPTTRVKMVDKRMRKMEGVLKDTKGFITAGPESADLTLVGWGSTYNILTEARQALEKEGVKVNHIHFRTLWPFHSEAASKALKAAKNTVCVESNFGGQLARLIRQETGFDMTSHIRKYDGEPFSLLPFLEKLRICLKGKAPAVQSLVSSELDIPIKRMAISA
jgi:2-oxoglutarate ferredoxin oxidoreductase subunit alpha